ncbi:MAG: sterol desaturase family protein [Roseibium sp.]
MFADIELRLSAIAALFNGIEYMGPVFLLVMASETVWDLVSGNRQSLKETGANVVIGIVYNLLERTFYGLILVGAIFLAETFAVFDIPMNWWSWVLALLAADLTYYWMHRCEHRVRLFWSYHSVHHSSPEFNFTTALRLGWAEALFEWMFFIPMVLFGFDPVQIIGGLIVVVAYQSWIHTEKVARLGWLEKILNTPSNHRVHHARNADYLDKNYGGILILWDRMLGTYAPEIEAPVYGITDPIGSSNPVTINFRDFAKLAGDVCTSETAAGGLKTIVMPPGWSANSQNIKTKQIPNPADKPTELS